TKPAPGKPAPAKPAGNKPATPTAATSYTVKAGDTLSAIAARHQMNVNDLAKLNGLRLSGFIFPGQVLKLTSSPTSGTPSTNQNLVPDTFLGYTYPAHVVAAANDNKALLNSLPVPSGTQMRQIVRATASQMGVDPSLAMAVAMQESGFNHRAVSPANAIGTMQVIPSSGEWASQLVGRKLNLIDPNDNVVAGVAILRSLLRSADSVDQAIAGYYQGLASVRANGMFADTRSYVANIKALQNQFR
ncbi:MAG: transglycosylase SLT domain-containing protein, partial [Bowdeniella nasicola]|nr:transglycosylase SLT domain-containing protein [Bowdeniella nasicola]